VKIGISNVQSPAVSPDGIYEGTILNYVVCWTVGSVVYVGQSEVGIPSPGEPVIVTVTNGKPTWSDKQ
jgi:hypothetical protein